eukprot:TRINITY_DN896_c1_g1_i1.p1 TRINITY_DN896_c1_g1~~TRINITY_DN896_c1_g1_i1.p1  ORF type:complete len:183 (-),score=64.93 TRINITY_DN896_c1_g1_i1:452-1000(-)
MLLKNKLLLIVINLFIIIKLIKTDDYWYGVNDCFFGVNPSELNLTIFHGTATNHLYKYSLLSLAEINDNIVISGPLPLKNLKWTQILNLQTYTVSLQAFGCNSDSNSDSNSNSNSNDTCAPLKEIRFDCTFVANSRDCSLHFEFYLYDYIWNSNTSKLSMFFEYQYNNEPPETKDISKTNLK